MILDKDEIEERKQKPRVGDIWYKQNDPTKGFIVMRVRGWLFKKIEIMEFKRYGVAKFSLIDESRRTLKPSAFWELVDETVGPGDGYPKYWLMNTLVQFRCPTVAEILKMDEELKALRQNLVILDDGD